MTVKEKLAELVGSMTDLEAKYAKALESLEAVRAEYSEACLLAEEGDAAARRQKEETRRRLDAAESLVRDLAHSVEADHKRRVKREREAAAKESERQWVLVMEHAKVRAQAAKDAEKAIARLVDAFDRLRQSNADIVNAIPVRVDRSGALLAVDELESVLRLQLRKAGFSWAFGWPWGQDSIPAFASRIQAANEYLERTRGESALAHTE